MKAERLDTLGDYISRPHHESVTLLVEIPSPKPIREIEAPRLKLYREA